MPGRVVTITALGNTKDLEASFKRAGLVVSDSANTMADASKRAGAAAAAAAKEAGAAADAQAAAAGRAAAGVVDAQAKMSRAQKAASDAAASAAKTAGASADEQVAAARRAADAQKASADEQVAANKKAADSSKAAADAHSKISKVGGVVALGLAGAAVEAVKLGTAYQTAQASIQGATGQSVKSAGELTKAFGATAGSSMESGQQMEAAYAGVAGQLKLTEGHALSTAEAMKVMKSATDLAEGSGTDLASSTSALAKTMATFHMGADQAAEAADALYNTSKALNMPIEGVATAMARLHGRLGEAAPSLKDVGGLMVDLGPKAAGGRGIMVLNTAFTTLLGNSKKTDETLKDLGVSVYNSQGKFVGMQSVIAQLQPKLAGLDQEQRKFALSNLFGKGAAELMNGVIQKGVPAFDQASAAVSRHNAALKAAEAQQKTLKGEMDTLKASVETLGGDLGLILIPKITAVAKALAEGIQWLEKHKAACIALGAVITGVLGTAVAVFAYDKSVQFVKGTQRMVEGLGGVGKKILETTGVIQSEGAAQAGAVEANAAKMQASNATAGASFTAVGGEAAAGEAATAGAVEGEAGAVTAADATIEADNVAAGKSFTALLGPIGVAVAAVVAAEPILNKLTGGGLSESGSTEKAAMQKAAEAQGPIKGGRASVGGTEGEILNYFLSKGFSSNAAAGIVGNVKLESSLNPNEPGGGLFQDIGGRGAGQGADTKQQLEAAYNELRTTQHGTFEQIQKARSPQEAAKLFESGFERPEGYNLPGEGGTAHSLQRERAAAEALKHIRATGGAPGTVAGGGTSTASNKALQEQMEEASGAKPKKKAAGTKAKAEPYVEPFAGASGLSRGRTDQGVDFGFSGPLAAIGAGTIVKIIQDPGGFGTELVEKLTQGARKGQYIYSGLETGAVSRVHEGEQVRAGQEIAHGLGRGGVELGFASGPGGVPITPFAPGQSHETATAGGTAFSKFIGAIGKGGTVLSAVTKAAETAEKAEAKRVTSLETAAKKLLGETTPRQSLTGAIQTGTVPQLEKVLGYSSTAPVASREVRGGVTYRSNESTSQRLAGTFAGQTAGLSQAALEHAVMPTLAKSAESSGTGKQFDKLVSELRATHQAGMVNLANQLTQAHKQALADLGRELYAVTEEKQAALVQAQATEQKDRTTQTANLAAKELQVSKDTSTQVTDAMSAAAKQIDDATTVIKDSFSEMVEAVQDATQQMTDIASGQVQQTQDTTAIKVAELGERGQYGLELIAQKEEVQLDQMKAQYDVQIQTAKLAVDQAKIAGQQLIAEKQQGVDLLQAHEDILVASAQAHVDAVQVSQDQQEVVAQSQLDTAQLASDIGIDLAKEASVLVASGTKAQQDAAKAYEARETSQGAKGVAEAEARVKAVESSANRAIADAQAALAQAQGESAQAIASAQQALAAAEGAAHVAIANAEQGLAAIEGTAKIAEAGLESKIAITREESQTQYAGSGLVVNQYGMDFGNAQANANELSWALTHQIPV